MPIDLDKFRSALLKEDLARSNLYKVTFPSKIGTTIQGSSSSSGGSLLGSLFDAVTKEVLSKVEPLRHLTGFYSPEILRAVGLGDMLDKYLQYPYDLGMYVKDVSVPGRAIDTEQVLQDQVAHGIATGSSFEPFNMTFLIAPSQRERQYFLDWLNRINDMDTNKFAFYETYVCNIQIYHYNRQGDQVAVSEVNEAYPVRVSEMALSYDADNALASFDVTFNYKKCVTRPASDDGDGNVFTEAKHWYDSIKRITSIL